MKITLTAGLTKILVFGVVPNAVKVSANEEVFKPPIILTRLK